MVGDEWSDGTVRVYVRQRPIHREEITQLEFDVVSVNHGKVITVHDARMHSDMKKMLMHHHEFRFDAVFDGSATNDSVYRRVAEPLVKEVTNQPGPRHQAPVTTTGILAGLPEPAARGR